MSEYEFESLFKKDTALIYDRSYVNKLFKRLERVCNASFYIAHKLKESEKDSKDVVRTSIEDTVVNILKLSSETLEGDAYLFKQHSISLSSLLLRLSAFVSLCATTERIPASHAALIEHEVHTTVSELAEFGRKQSDYKPQRSHTPSRYAPKKTQGQDEDTSPVPGGHLDTAVRQSMPLRKDRIRTILQEKGQIGIKDISDIIKDVSEKSIQRDLNDMIESGEIVRVGERRWSTYKIA
jgi:hypothetical protein